jgi:hypothetical protein
VTRLSITLLAQTLGGLISASMTIASATRAGAIQIADVDEIADVTRMRPNRRSAYPVPVPAGTVARSESENKRQSVRADLLMARTRLLKGDPRVDLLSAALCVPSALTVPERHPC